MSRSNATIAQDLPEPPTPDGQLRKRLVCGLVIKEGHQPIVVDEKGCALDQVRGIVISYGMDRLTEVTVTFVPDFIEVAE